MKVLFIGEGLTDYINQIFNRLNRQPGVEIVNLVDTGVGHVAAGSHQTKEGVMFTIVELQSIVTNKHTNNSYRMFPALAELLHTIRPDVISCSEKYLKMFLYDKALASTVHELGIKLLMNDNPLYLEPYEKRREAIVAGQRDEEYAPIYVFYAVSWAHKLGFSGKALITFKHWMLWVLNVVKLYTKAIGRKKMLEALEEKKRFLNYPSAHISYVEKAIELYGSYGVPKEKVFIRYNSPDTDMLFDIRKKIEQEPPLLPLNPYRLIHVGRLIPWKRVDMLIEAVKVLQKEFQNIELLVIGKGPEEDNLQALTKKLELESAVQFVGGVYDPAVLGKYLLSSSVYVLAGMGGISINDAMAFGKPVLCSIGDGTEKHLVFEGENGRYFKNGDKEDLIQKIRELFSDQALLASMGEKSTDIITNKINIHTVIGAYIKAFNYALETH